jgi:hypothetical protein
MKWSYSESPFFCYGQEYFDEVRRLFDVLGFPDSEDLDACIKSAEYKVDAMEQAMARVDRAGLFGTGLKRMGIVVNVEVMPPDYSNTERAMRLNPPEALIQWLPEAGELPD